VHRGATVFKKRATFFIFAITLCVADRSNRNTSKATVYLLRNSGKHTRLHDQRGAKGRVEYVEFPTRKFFYMF